MGMETAPDTEKELAVAGNFHMVIAWGLNQDVFAEGSGFQNTKLDSSHSGCHFLEKNQEQPLSYLVSLYQKNNREVACQNPGISESVWNPPSHLNISHSSKFILSDNYVET